MRLLDSQIENINQIVQKYIGSDCRIYLFGSRINNKARGGDIDLFIETSKIIPRIQQARIKMELESTIGLPVDLVIKYKGKAPSSFEKIIIEQAVPLSITKGE